MTDTKVETEEVDAMQFDPAKATVEFARDVATKKECAEILTHYGMPKFPASWKLSEVRAMAATTIAARTLEAAGTSAAPGVPEAEPEVEETAAVEQAHKNGHVSIEEQTPGVELEPSRPDHVSIIPDSTKWQQLLGMANVIAKSGLCPAALKTPEDVAVVLLAANDLGIPATQALDKIFVLDGKKGMAAELMVALVIRDGHSIFPDAENDAQKATVHCRRRDTGAEATVTFTLDDAIAAKLVTIKDGKPYARTQGGKPKPWETFTPDMLWARAVSRACRRMFPDCLAGVSYTPDELGYIDADDDPAPRKDGRHGEANVSLDEERSKVHARVSEFRAACGRVGEPARGVWTTFTSEKRPAIVESSPAQLRAWTQALDKAEAALAEISPDPGSDPAIEDAQVVEPETPETPGEHGEESAGSGAPDGAEPSADVEGSVGAENPETGAEGSDADDVEICGQCGEELRDGDSVIEDGGKLYHAGHEPF